MQRLGGNLDQAAKQGELVGGIFGFVAQDAQQILVDVLGHGAIIPLATSGGQGELGLSAPSLTFSPGA